MEAEKEREGGREKEMLSACSVAAVLHNGAGSLLLLAINVMSF